MPGYPVLLVIVGRDRERAEAIAAQLGGEAVKVACDLGDAQAISELAGTVGDIDHLVLSAAVPVAGPSRKCRSSTRAASSTTSFGVTT